jgi:hypothetical protein
MPAVVQEYKGTGGETSDEQQSFVRPETIGRMTSIWIKAELKLRLLPEQSNA